MNISPFEKKSAPPARPVDELAGAAVLIVEDERDLAEEIRLELQSSGHPVRLAETVHNGLAAARSGVAVLIVDRMLQGEDGLSIIEALRAEGNATPALVISALSSVDERINGLKAGGDDYLIKPFDIRELTRGSKLCCAGAATRESRDCRPALSRWISSNGPCAAMASRSISCRGNSRSSNISCAVQARS